MPNPLVDDRFVDFLLDAVHPLDPILALDAFAEHDRDTCRMYLETSRRFAREVLFDSYHPMDAEQPVFEGGRVRMHPRMEALWPRLLELGVLTAARSPDVGGFALPGMVALASQVYLMAANGSAMGLVGLTTAAAHLIEVFGDETARGLFLDAMYSGRWTGTMALTEPHAGSSLGDLSTTATPRGDGTHAIVGNKIFISGGDHQITENVVHLTLARIAGAPPGTKGISLFAIPARRPVEGGLEDTLEDNDVTVTQMLHKVGWRGLPSLGIAFGERGDCRGWLVGEPGQGLRAMFQMMNEARIGVGAQATATASVAYHEAVAYARERTQGRPPAGRDPGAAQVPIIEHADVRRMLLRQRAIVEGSLALTLFAARCADLARHDAEGRRPTHRALLDVLTPIVKTFPAEYGFESCALALQIHGGYGYTTEYLPEAWLRDQKLNTIHEGTTGIQGLDLLGRKVMQKNGAGLKALFGAIEGTIARAHAAGVPPAWCDAARALDARFGEVTMGLGLRGMKGDVDGMLSHSHHYLTALSIHVIGWQWLAIAAAASGHDAPFHRARMRAAQYWFAVEVPRVGPLLDLCAEAEDSYAGMPPEWF